MYAVGSVADLISGSKSPNKKSPKLKKIKSEHMSPQNSPLKPGTTPTNSPWKATKNTPMKSPKNTPAEMKTPNQQPIKSETKVTPNKQQKSPMSKSPQQKQKYLTPSPKKQTNPNQSPKKQAYQTQKFIKQENQKSPKPGSQKKQFQRRPILNPEKQQNQFKKKVPKTENKDDNKINKPMKRKASTTESNAESRAKKFKPDTPEKKERTVFVGNVPINTTDAELKSLFKKFGAIESVRFRGIPQADPKVSKKVALYKKQFNTKRSAVIAYVVFVNKEDAAKAPEMNGQIFKEHYLRVNLVLSPKLGVSSKSIFVGNLPFDAEDNDLFGVFQDCGPIDSVRISRDAFTGIGRGFAFVNFKTTDGVELALQLENVILKSRKLRIKRADSYERKENNWISLKIDNLPQLTPRKHIFNIFKKYGKVINITFIKNMPLYKQTKIAFIAFDTPEAADKAFKIRSKLLKRSLYITKSPFNPHNHVFLRDVPINMTDKFIFNKLKDCGPITKCKLLLQPKPPHTVGFGIVEFKTVQSAEKALEMKSIQIGDNCIKIENYIKHNMEQSTSVKNEDSSDDEMEQNGEQENESDDDEDSDDEMEQDDEDNDKLDEEDDNESDSDAEQEVDDDSDDEEENDDEDDDDDDAEEDDDEEEEEDD